MTEPSASNSTGKKCRSPEPKVGQAMLRKPPMPEKGPNHGLTTPESRRHSYLSLKDIGREKKEKFRVPNGWFRFTKNNKK